MPAEAAIEVRVHQRERVIEVTYPKRLTPDSLKDYEQRLRDAVATLGAHPKWRCLVDQTKLDVIPPHLTDHITEMNRWAAKHGLVAAARVVKKTAVGELQSKRILRESGLGHAHVFFDRDEAWQVLLSDAS